MCHAVFSAVLQNLGALLLYKGQVPASLSGSVHARGGGNLLLPGA